MYLGTSIWDPLLCDSSGLTFGLDATGTLSSWATNSLPKHCLLHSAWLLNLFDLVWFFSALVGHSSPW